MFRNSVRLLTSGRPISLRLSQTQNAILTPRLASKQFIEPDTPQKKERKLRRREKRMKKQIIRDVNTLKQYDAKNVPYQVDPVLGDRRSKFFSRILEKIEDQETKLANGIDRVEFEKILFAAEKLSLEKASNNEEIRQNVKAVEESKKKAVLTILNLKNTDSKDKKKLAIQYAREELQREPGDTASPEVQAAVMTVKIHFGMKHIKANKNDHATTQVVRELVQYRQKILKYLKRKDPKKYYYALAKLGLTDDVIDTEFSMGRQYLQDYKIWGDKVLIKETQSEKRKNNKIRQLRERVSGYHELAKRNYEIMKKEKQA
ncbi:uncharacterized protein KGF55_000220 [Candida pseudojiufengensis]|uniref:uncharacterized protein n=1 Tax=Candida pseudojiufengensis TaxID=497109 RepID=UPI0022254816|nr:uncharacterized protein KGF55_000220 [Candida pseudojiufengensis]KAI5966811.1 hypothetical protein KGF55_000220 [Candida pseudojiufengensis]